MLQWPLKVPSIRRKAIIYMRFFGKSLTGLRSLGTRPRTAAAGLILGRTGFEVKSFGFTDVLAVRSAAPPDLPKIAEY